VNSPEAILADNSARLFSSRSWSTLLTTPSSTESFGLLPFEEEHAMNEEDDPLCVVFKEHGKREQDEEKVVVGLSGFMVICLE